MKSPNWENVRDKYVSNPRKELLWKQNNLELQTNQRTKLKNKL